MFSESDCLPLSALQHLIFCPRQCALIHIDQTWEENRFTAEGRVLHERTHQHGFEVRDGVRIVRSLRLRSLALGLIGVADVVEFHPATDASGEGVALPRRRGKWRPFPVEYKRGRPKSHDADRIQLCAQAICLEEMLGARIPEGALFYGQSRRRQEVAFDEPLRRATHDAAGRLHALVDSAQLPPPEPGPKCKTCSLRETCMPDAIGGGNRARAYVSRLFRDSVQEEIQ